MNKEIILLIPTIINIIAMIGVIGICLVELNSAYIKGRTIRIIQYLVLMTGTMLSGFQPLLWATIPSLGTALLSTSCLVFLVIHVFKRRTMK